MPYSLISKEIAEQTMPIQTPNADQVINHLMKAQHNIYMQQH